MMKKIVIAGATGYLGSHIVQHLQKRQLDFQAIARSPRKLDALGLASSQIIEEQVTDASSLAGCLEGADVLNLNHLSFIFPPVAQ